MSERYKIIRTLGEGSFGKCYLVETQSTHERRVIKQIDLNPLSREEQSESLREAKILEQLNHPNIIKFHEVYKTKRKKLCIVMDYADGGDLATLIRKLNGVQMDENRVLDLFVQICLAIKHVHDRKILHRDLKAQNIFLMTNGTVRLGDFGIAKVLRSTRDNAKSMVGTPYYLSPEIVQNRPYSFKSDIWSLGVLLYEMCALVPPFQANSIHGLALQIVQGKYPPLQGSFSPSLKSLIGLLLTIAPEDRPTIHDVLWIPIIRQRIHCFLSDTIHQQEFSHTLLHGLNILKKPQGRRESNPIFVDAKQLMLVNSGPNSAEVKLTEHQFTSGSSTPILSPENMSMMQGFDTTPTSAAKPQENVAFFVPLDSGPQSEEYVTSESLTNQQFLTEYAEAASRDAKRKVMLADIKEKKVRHSIKTEAFVTASDIQLQALEESSPNYQQAKEEKEIVTQSLAKQAQIYELQEALLEQPGEATPVQIQEITTQPDREDEIMEVAGENPCDVSQPNSELTRSIGQDKSREMRAELQREMGEIPFYRAYEIIQELEERKAEEEPSLEFYFEKLRGVVKEEEMEQRVIQILVLLDLEKDAISPNLYTK